MSYSELEIWLKDGSRENSVMVTFQGGEGSNAVLQKCLGLVMLFYSVSLPMTWKRGWMLG